MLISPHDARTSNLDVVDHDTWDEHALRGHLGATAGHDPPHAIVIDDVGWGVPLVLFRGTDLTARFNAGATTLLRSRRTVVKGDAIVLTRTLDGVLEELMGFDLIELTTIIVRAEFGVDIEGRPLPRERS